MKQVNPYPNSYSNKRYKTFDYEMKRLFGRKVAKVPLDGGFTCPNIDGSRGIGGCSYCSSHPSGARKPLAEQYEEAIAPLLKKWTSKNGTPPLFIPYFQYHTNTYAPTELLRELYYEALALPGAVGLSVGTRADCISDTTAELLREIDKKTYLTVELGLQSTHDATADRINRCHSYDEFLQGYRKLDGIRRAIHIINGLPGEDREMMLQTARDIVSLEPYEVKIHMLYIASGTHIADEYARGELSCLTREEYVGIVCDQIELLPPDTVIGRLTGDGLESELIAPEWTKKKTIVINEIDKELYRRGSWQGKLYNIDKNSHPISTMV